MMPGARGTRHKDPYAVRTVLNLSVSPQDRDRWTAAANRNELSRSEYVRQMMRLDTPRSGITSGRRHIRRATERLKLDTGLTAEVPVKVISSLETIERYLRSIDANAE